MQAPLLAGLVFSFGSSLPAFLTTPRGESNVVSVTGARNGTHDNGLWGDSVRSRARCLLSLCVVLVATTVTVAAGPPVCEPGSSGGGVQAPIFVDNLSGQTSWFASPVVADLDGDGANELIAAYYDVYVFGSDRSLLDTATDGSGRVYAPHVVADLDGDGITEVVAGRGHQVWAWEWKGGALEVKNGWPADTTTGGNSPEIRGMAAADLDGDLAIEIVVTTTQTVPTSSGGAQVFVFSADGSTYQPAGGHAPAWPRYNNLTGTGNDADRNGPGHSGFGCYGLNVGIGDIDDDRELEILATYDNHHIQAFDHDGVAIDSSGYYTNRTSPWVGNRLTWGQFIRWADPDVEHDHYNFHTGTWPNPSWTEWLQWTASPPGVVDLDGDGQLEIFVQTFDHGLDVFTVPGSGTNCLLWPTARGGPWRMGQQNGPWMLTDLFADGFEFGHTLRWSRTVP